MCLQMVLLDFGTCRSYYTKQFMYKYIEVISASEDDKNKVLTISREIEFLMGYESKVK